MVITNEQLAARRYARQVAEYRDWRSQNDYRRIVMLDMADMVEVLRTAYAVHDNTLISQYERAIIDQAKKLVEPIPDDNNWPDTVTPADFCIDDVTEAIRTARKFKATDDDLALWLAQAVRGDVDEPEPGSLAEALYLWTLRRSAAAALNAESAKSQRNQKPNWRNHHAEVG